MVAEKKNIVIIGLGLGSTVLAHSLEKTLPPTHRLVVITESDAAYDAPASVRAAVVPGFEKKVVLPAKDLFPADSPHIVLHSTKVLELSANSVKVDKINPGFGATIEFDYAVVATGATYGNAFQPPRGRTLSQITSDFNQAQRALAAASSILIVGAGPTGIELAGEIKEHHPTKTVTLVGHNADLTPGKFSPKLGKTLEQQVRKAGIALHLQTRLDTGKLVTGPISEQTFELPSGGSVKADYLIIAYGTKANGELMAAFDPLAMSDRGAIKVGPTMQVTGQPTLFAMGDVAETADAMTALAAQSHASFIAPNIVSLLSGKEPTKVWKPAMSAILVTIGSKGGAAQLPLPVFSVLGGWFASMVKGKDLMTERWKGTFYGRTIVAAA